MGVLFSQKLLASLVTVSVFLFSSFKGNDASFSTMQIHNSGNYLILQSNLVNSFDNDFQDIFQSGKQVDVWFNLEIKQNKNILYKQEFRHSVQYDHLSSVYKVFLEEQHQNISVKDYSEMIRLMSHIEYSLPSKHEWKKIDIHLDSYLKTMRIESLKKEINLMVLWKLKKPECKESVDLKTNEN
jgi:hypothetical protein